MRSVPLALVVHLLHGQRTAVFKREPLPELEQLSFSLIYKERCACAWGAPAGVGCSRVSAAAIAAPCRAVLHARQSRRSRKGGQGSAAPAAPPAALQPPRREGALSGPHLQKW